VGLVVTPPERRRGRRGSPTPTPVGAEAERLGLPVLATPNINDDADVARVHAAAPQLLVVVAFGQLLRKPVRDVPVRGCLNLHFSLLPRWRGAAPVQRAILAGDDETGACVQRLVAKLDAGDVLAEAREPIRPTDDSPTLRARLVERGSPLLRDVVTRLLADEDLPATEQDAECITLAPRIAVVEGHLDPVAETAAQLDRRIRALDEWPGCRAVLTRSDGADVAVLVRGADPVPEVEICESVTAGEVVRVDAAGLVIATRGGALRITRLQKQGKKPLGIRDFLNGCPLAAGDRLVAPSPG